MNLCRLREGILPSAISEGDEEEFVYVIITIGSLGLFFDVLSSFLCYNFLLLHFVIRVSTSVHLHMIRRRMYVPCSYIVLVC